MTQPIYQLIVMNNNIASNLAWKALPEAERKVMEEQERASREAVGADTFFGCESAWADEMHPWWGMIRFPDLKARIEHTRTLQKIGWLEITDAFTLLGTAITDWTPTDLPSPIYNLWIIKNNPATAITGHMAKGLDALRWEKHDALHKENNSQMLLLCDSGWCNESYPAFGISAYPNIEAHMKIVAGLNELGWPGYFESITYLGIAST